MRITRRQWMFGAAAVAAGCRRRRNTEQLGNSLTILYPYDETVLGPVMNEPAQFLTFLPLVTWNTRGELEGRLAEHWEHSRDYRSWTVQLRDGIYWHDGVPVTADDIKINLDLRSSPDVLWFEPGSFNVRVLDRRTFTITHNRSGWNGWSGGFMDDWTVYYPKHRLENLDPKDFYSWDFWTHPVGNGPYRHVRTVPKTMLHLEANPEFYRGKPTIENVILKVGGESGNGVTSFELLSGDVDAATEVSRTDILKMSRDPRFRVYDQVSEDMITALFWNHTNVLFQDRNVRRALRLAVNHPELFQLLSLPSKTPILDSPLSKRLMRRGAFPEPIPFDPVLADRLLNEAGWVRRSREGIRIRDGHLFSFRVIAEMQGASSVYETAVYLQAQLKKIGIRMELEAADRSSVYQRLKAGDYEAGILTCGMNQYMDYPALAGYNSPQHRAIVDRLQMAFDPADQDQGYADLAAVFHQDVPAVALYPQVLTTIVSKRLHGLERSAYPGDPTWCMDQLSLGDQN